MPQICQLRYKYPLNIKSLHKIKVDWLTISQNVKPNSKSLLKTDIALKKLDKFSIWKHQSIYCVYINAFTFSFKRICFYFQAWE